MMTFFGERLAPEKFGNELHAVLSYRRLKKFLEEVYFVEY